MPRACRPLGIAAIARAVCLQREGADSCQPSVLFDRYGVVLINVQEMLHFIKVDACGFRNGLVAFSRRY